MSDDDHPSEEVTPEPVKPVSRMLGVNRYRNAEKAYHEAASSIAFISKAVPKVAGQKIDALEVVIALANIELRRRNEKWEDARRLVITHVAQNFDLPVENIYMSTTWGCESNGPLKACFYDNHEDPCHDYCLYCEQPTERK